MNKKWILSAIEEALRDFSKRQLDLDSDKDRKELALQVLSKISTKVYMISYSSQDTFE